MQAGFWEGVCRHTGDHDKGTTVGGAAHILLIGCRARYDHVAAPLDALFHPLYYRPDRCSNTDSESTLLCRRAFGRGYADAPGITTKGPQWVDRLTYYPQEVSAVALPSQPP